MRTSERALRNIRGRKKEIERRHARAKHKPDLRAIRIREIVRLLQYRYGGDELPLGADGETAAFILACHLALLNNPTKRLNGHFDMRAPWMTPAERDEVIAKTLGRPNKWTAVRLGKKLGLTDAERSALKLTTIRSVDGLAPKERKRQRDRERRRQKRKAAGALTRQQYLSESAERFKPWEREGVSRRTWYRLLKKDRAANCTRKVAQVGRHHTSTLLLATNQCHGGAGWLALREFPVAARDDDGGCK